MFKEILEKQAGPGVSADEQLFLNNFFATASIGGLGLLLYFGIIKRDKATIKKAVSAYLNKDKIFRKVAWIYTKKATYPACAEPSKGIRRKIKSKLQKIANKTLQPVKRIVRKVSGKIKHAIKVVRKSVAKTIKKIKKYTSRVIKNSISSAKKKLKRIFKRK